MKTTSLPRPPPTAASKPDPPDTSGRPLDTDGAWSKALDEARFLTDPANAVRALEVRRNSSGE